MARSMRGYLCAVLALVAVTAAAAQDCPDLFSNTAADSESLVRDCTGAFLPFLLVPDPFSNQR
jgi:hypothetical protein